MSFGDCRHTSGTHQETSCKRGANFLILNQMILTDANISQGFLIIVDNIKNDVKWQKMQCILVNLGFFGFYTVETVVIN